MNDVRCSAAQNGAKQCKAANAELKLQRPETPAPHTEPTNKEPDIQACSPSSAIRRRCCYLEIPRCKRPTRYFPDDCLYLNFLLWYERWLLFVVLDLLPWSRVGRVSCGKLIWS